MRKALTRDRVLLAAVGIADRDGLPAVTMRRLGAELGVEAMSLYHHLRGKDALLDGVAETLIGEVLTAVAAADGPGGWRVRLRAWFLAAREVMLRHRWGPGLLNSRATVPFGVLRHYDAIIGVMVGDGLSYRIAHRALHAFGSMPLGFVQEAFSPSGDGGDGGMSAVADRLPHLAAMVASEAHEAELGWCDSQVEFEFTLDLLLDGLDRARRSEDPLV
ncbi:TetR family transcriptional regulator [Actinoplanes philippinensis]|uniref:Regulatory protein, tetR family n=1 Tax=Actinoplanes philippinensis TaxID=35752 RepID=A0A1I2KG10_9ACTN|nr:TetR/AcrR family transcriptional regulator C-terminal domain-containing protein [Actinoplanes philippinensis]GIE81864.1 TetR family transcriptional regulator [Actinoplanes philippinensis]SFF64167.1 regulatory protein, tetR family [Actinoplanes philippinensis]